MLLRYDGECLVLYGPLDRLGKRAVEYPSQDAVLQLHEKIVRQSGGQLGFVSVSNLANVLETSQDIGEGLREEQAVVRKAGYLLFNLVNLHPFLDGNKRTAFEVAKTFLDLNGWSFDPPEEEAFSTLKAVSSGAIDAESTEDWVGRNLSRRRSKR
jgi:death-on-curing protein